MSCNNYFAFQDRMKFSIFSYICTQEEQKAPNTFLWYLPLCVSLQSRCYLSVQTSFPLVLSNKMSQDPYCHWIEAPNEVTCIHWKFVECSALKELMTCVCNDSLPFEAESKQGNGLM